MRDTQQSKAKPGATSARSSCPRTVGPWRLIRLLGEGEWCQVFQAAPHSVMRGMSADYVVKLIHPSKEGNPHAASQLQNEAFVCGTVAHPHVVCLLSAHIDRPPFYLVMPFLQGVNLRKRLGQSQGLPVANCLWIARQVAEGITALHEKGWAHCDVKPENVQIAPNGHATLCDLGLACPLERLPNQQNALVGTPAYMPPEAFGGEAARTAAADSYSLGIMLFEMLTGQRPFPHRDPEELMAAHRLLRAPDPRTLLPDLPSGVSHLVRRMLAKEPMRRPSGRELIDWLVNSEIDLFELRQAA